MNTPVETTKETDLFSTLAATWWDETGPFKALHAMNPVRMEFMLSHICHHFRERKDFKLLDIGCGGGLICEPFARLGYHVTGIDQSEEAIRTALLHSKEQGLSINYYCADVETVEDTYDIITVLEVLEHVENPIRLLESAVKRLAPGGLIFFSTLNRTTFSYVAGIFLAEKVLKWAPKGTHEWSKFLKPSEIILPLEDLGVSAFDIKGINLSAVSRKWRISKDLHGNYIGVGIKKNTS